MHMPPPRLAMCCRPGCCGQVCESPSMTGRGRGGHSLTEGTVPSHPRAKLQAVLSEGLVLVSAVSQMPVAFPEGFLCPSHIPSQNSTSPVILQQGSGVSQASQSTLEMAHRLFRSPLASKSCPVLPSAANLCVVPPAGPQIC